MRSIWAAVLVALALLWAGMVLGIDFIAVPAQFSAAGLSPPLGIDITRHVFATFTRVELGLAALTLIVAALGRPGRLLLLLLAVLWLVVVLESLWLLPVLDLRADQLLQGQEPAPGPWHGLYAGAEIIKLAALMLTAWLASRRSASG